MAATTAPAAAQGFFTPFAGYNYGGDSLNCVSLRNCDERRTNLGISFGKTGQYSGTEQDISYASHFFGDREDANNSMFTAMTNFLVIVPAGPVRPYGVLGIGLIRPMGKNAFGYDIGLGTNVFFTKRFGVRVDLRRMRSLQDVELFEFTEGHKVDYWRASLGVTFR
jgi:Outer membrane protein beta-barrel domain